MKTFWNPTYDWLQKRSIKLIFFVNKSIDCKKIAISLDSSLGIPYLVLWLNVWNKELLTLRNFFVVTKKFLKAKFDCILFLMGGAVKMFFSYFCFNRWTQFFDDVTFFLFSRCCIPYFGSWIPKNWQGCGYIRVLPRPTRPYIFGFRSLMP
jgi:hypothetical protein